MAVAWTIGSFVSGPMLRRLKMNIRRILSLIVIFYGVVLLCYLTLMFLGCSEAQWADTITQEGSAQRSSSLPAQRYLARILAVVVCLSVCPSVRLL